MTGLQQCSQQTYLLQLKAQPQSLKWITSKQKHILSSRTSISLQLNQTSLHQSIKALMCCKQHQHQAMLQWMHHTALILQVFLCGSSLRLQRPDTQPLSLQARQMQTLLRRLTKKHQFATDTAATSLQNVFRPTLLPVRVSALDPVMP